MRAFIDQHRLEFGVEPICKVLKIAPSGYWKYLAQQKNPQLRSNRVKRHELLMDQIQSIWMANHQVYGVRKVYQVLLRQGIKVARCTVKRLMGKLSISGVIRGKPKRTTFGDPQSPCPRDLVNRQFVANRPNQLWVADFTYVSTWQGFVYVAFIVDVFARKIVGWRTSQNMRTDFVLDALEQALYARKFEKDQAPIHHSDRGSQYVSIRYSERLAQAGLEPSVGSKGDSYDNALAETINGLYKAEVIHRKSSWKTIESVELATLQWVAWYNNQRIMESLGYRPPDEVEQAFYQHTNPENEPLST